MKEYDDDLWSLTWGDRCFRPGERLGGGLLNTHTHTHTHTHSILSSMLMHFNQWSMSPVGVTWPSFSPSPAGFLRTLAFSRKHWLMFAAHDNAVISSLNVKIETLMMISLIVIHERGNVRRLVCVCVFESVTYEIYMQNECDISECKKF